MRIIKGICPHVVEDANKSGCGFSEFKKIYDGSFVFIVQSWQSMIIEKFGRNTLVVDEDLTLCKECLLELVRDIELYEKTFDNS